MHSYREDTYNIYTKYKVHVQKQNILPNQEVRLSVILTTFKLL